jgi:hypothetical protein
MSRRLLGGKRDTADEVVIEQVWPGAYCYDSESCDKKYKVTRVRVTDGPGGRGCMDVATGPSPRAAVHNAAEKARSYRK